VRKTTHRKKAVDQYKEIVVVSDSDESLYDERMSQLNRALEVLNTVERAIIMLHMASCSNKEIAEIIGITPSNVSTRLLRIKNKLKKEVKK